MLILFSVLITATYWIFPSAVVAMVIFNPCKPPLLGGYLLCPTSALGVLNIFWIPVIAGAEFILCMQVALLGSHQVLYSLLGMIALFWGNTSQFLKSHGLPRNENFRKESLLAYRELQITEKILNSIFRTRVFLPLLVAVPLIQILSGVAFLTQYHTTGSLFLIVFVVTWFEATFTTMLSLSAGSVIYTKTSDWILDGRRQGGGRELGRKLLKSCRPLRLEFGSNFIDRLTPLVMQEFCVRNTASLLLLRGLGKTVKD